MGNACCCECFVQPPQRRTVQAYPHRGHHPAAFKNKILLPKDKDLLGGQFTGSRITARYGKYGRSTVTAPPIMNARNMMGIDNPAMNSQDSYTDHDFRNSDQNLPPAYKMKRKNGSDTRYSNSNQINPPRKQTLSISKGSIPPLATSELGDSKDHLTNNVIRAKIICRAPETNLATRCYGGVTTTPTSRHGGTPTITVTDYTTTITTAEDTTTTTTTGNTTTTIAIVNTTTAEDTKTTTTAEDTTTTTTTDNTKTTITAEDTATTTTAGTTTTTATGQHVEVVVPDTTHPTNIGRTYSAAPAVPATDGRASEMNLPVQVSWEGQCWIVQRRLRDFLALEDGLSRKFGWISSTPPLCQQDPLLVAHLQYFLHMVLQETKLLELAIVRQFLDLREPRSPPSTKNSTASTSSTSTNNTSNSSNTLADSTTSTNQTLSASVTDEGTNININLAYKRDKIYAETELLEDILEKSTSSINSNTAKKSDLITDNKSIPLLIIPDSSSPKLSSTSNILPPCSTTPPPPYSKYVQADHKTTAPQTRHHYTTRVVKPLDARGGKQLHSTMVGKQLGNSLNPAQNANSPVGQVLDRRRHSSINVSNPEGPHEEMTPDDFHFLGVIGKGSFGQVLLARHKATGKPYAVKMLSKRMIVRRHETEHVLSERSVLIKVLDHPYVVQLHFAFTTQHKIFLVLEYVNGGELFFHLQRERVFPEPRAMFYAAEICCALTYMHTKGIVYRDLKPENLLLDKEGHVVLTDFGLCKEGLKTSSSHTGTFCGTPEYLAPEILLKKAYTRVVDWWTLGAVLYEMLYGLPPFYSKNRLTMYEAIVYKPIKLKQTSTSRARNILTALLQKVPEQRLGSGPEDGEAIMQHEFFRTVDWQAVEARSTRPPFVPKVSGATDTRNIDPSLKKEVIQIGSVCTSSPESMSESAMHGENAFKEFNYVRPLVISDDEEDDGDVSR